MTRLECMRVSIGHADLARRAPSDSNNRGVAWECDVAEGVQSKCLVAAMPCVICA